MVWSSDNTRSYLLCRETSTLITNSQPVMRRLSRVWVRNQNQTKTNFPSLSHPGTPPWYSSSFRSIQCNYGRLLRVRTVPAKARRQSPLFPKWQLGPGYKGSTSGRKTYPFCTVIDNHTISGNGIYRNQPWIDRGIWTRGHGAVTGGLSAADWPSSGSLPFITWSSSLRFIGGIGICGDERFMWTELIYVGSSGDVHILLYAEIWSRTAKEESLDARTALFMTRYTADRDNRCCQGVRHVGRFLKAEVVRIRQRLLLTETQKDHLPAAKWGGVF